MEKKIYEVGGEIDVWEDDGVICIKIRNKFNDPTELAEHEAIELANVLIELAKDIREK